MFDNIHFTRFGTSGSKQGMTNIAQNVDALPPEERSSRLSAYGPLGNSDYFIAGQTAILFPPVNVSLNSEGLFTPQGFYLCDHWEGYFHKREQYRSFMLCYTISGEGALEYEGTTYRLKEHDVFLIDCRNFQHYYTRGTSWQHVDVHFYGGYAEPLYREYLSNGGPVYHSNETMLQHLEELAAVWDSSRLYPALYISNKLGEILTALLTLSKNNLLTETQSNTFSNTIEYINTHFAEELQLDRLASSASMSKYHFSRMFKKYTGLPPVEYVIHLRITRAKSMLADTNLSIKQIAFTVGFRDINNFIKQFKKTESITPSAYRRQFRPHA